ncbi:MAG: helix-hairpin-helix domain-containing protein [Cyclobacteriaceae bacterium]|nr:helix-hairpin-helix domain-containing protein [Cyclobacteriaceae bacterium]
MNQIKKWIRGFFGFSRTETNGFVILLPLMVLILFSEPVYRWYRARETRDFSIDRAKLDSLVLLWNIRVQQNSKTDHKDSTRSELFPFNPNGATIEQLQALGFSKGLSTRIANYRLKGGQFRVKSDLLKIYGMDSAFFQQVYPYIQLPDVHTIQETIPRIKRNAAQKLNEKFDLNAADTAQLKRISGIGEKLSLRIVRYRELLGGFIQPAQLKEVYGLDSLVIARLGHASFIEDNFMPATLNINSLSEKDLSSHPYISKTMAKAIVTYRFQHGAFQNAQEIRNIHSIRKEEADKLIPYLAVR